ncbi:MAG: c-type cytochrome [bacterium]
MLRVSSTVKPVLLYIALMAQSFSLFGSEPGSESDTSTDVGLIYVQTCIVCHGEGVHGAPRPGVKSDWEGPLSYGKEEIYLNTFEGIGEMPSRGLCDECSDEQLKAVVDFMMMAAP